MPSSFGGHRPPLQKLAVATDGFDRAAFHGFFAERFFFWTLRLLVNVRMAAVVVPFKIRRRSLAAEVAVDALIVDVKLSFDIFGVFVSDISHSFFVKCGFERY